MTIRFLNWEDERHNWNCDTWHIWLIMIRRGNNSYLDVFTFCWSQKHFCSTLFDNLHMFYNFYSLKVVLLCLNWKSELWIISFSILHEQARVAKTGECMETGDCIKGIVWRQTRGWWLASISLIEKHFINELKMIFIYVNLRNIIVFIKHIQWKLIIFDILS